MLTRVALAAALALSCLLAGMGCQSKPVEGGAAHYGYTGSLPAVCGSCGAK